MEIFFLTLKTGQLRTDARFDTVFWDYADIYYFWSNVGDYGS